MKYKTTWVIRDLFTGRTKEVDDQAKIEAAIDELLDDACGPLDEYLPHGHLDAADQEISERQRYRSYWIRVDCYAETGEEE